LAPVHVVVGSLHGDNSYNPMFKRLFEWARSGSDERPRDDLVHWWCGTGCPPKECAVIPEESRRCTWSGRQDLNLRPLGPEGPSADPHGVAPGHLASYPVDNTGVGGHAGSHTLAPFPPVATPFGALVVRDAVGQLLTVREVADRLRVSRATVYRLVQSGAVSVLRVSNSIRIPTECLGDALRAASCLPTSSAPTSRSRDSSGSVSRPPEQGLETLERPR
jgi:excisionase family DNA binding protein